MSNNIEKPKDIKIVEQEISNLENKKDWDSVSIEYLKYQQSKLGIQDTKKFCNIVDSELCSWVEEEGGDFMKVLRTRKNIDTV